MNFIRNSAALLISCIVLISANSAEACTVRWRVPYGVDGSGIMLTKSGASCTTTISHRGTMMENLVVTVKPQHGSATVESLDKINYQPKAGYHGPDSFSFLSDYGAKGKSNVTLNITVE